MEREDQHNTCSHARGLSGQKRGREFDQDHSSDHHTEQNSHDSDYHTVDLGHSSDYHTANAGLSRANKRSKANSGLAEDRPSAVPVVPSVVGTSAFPLPAAAPAEPEPYRANQLVWAQYLNWPHWPARVSLHLVICTQYCITMSLSLYGMQQRYAFHWFS